jgi:hypothetical protein
VQRRLTAQEVERPGDTIPSGRSQWRSARFRLLQGIAKRLPGATLLTVVPAIFLIVALQLTNASGPQWLGTNFENSYPYLFNSLLLVKKQTPSMIEHPGIVTQLFGETILKTSGYGSHKELVNAVLENPEKFIKRIHRAMLIFSALALWAFPLAAALEFRSWTTGLLLQVPSLLFVTLLRYSIWFGSDLMLVSCCVATLSLCAMLVRQSWTREQSRSLIVVAGALCALGIATKLTFFPLILITFVCVRGLRNRIYLGVSLVVGTAIALIPIYPQLSRFRDWIFGIAIHTGRYGAGSFGFPRSETYVHSIKAQLAVEPALWWIPLFGALGVLIASLVSRSSYSNQIDRRHLWTAIALFVVQAISFLLVVKHPGPHYFIPLYLSTGLNLVLLWDSARDRAKPPLIRALGAGLALVLVLCGLNLSFTVTKYTYRVLGLLRKQQVELYSRVLAKIGNDLRVDYYRSASPEFAIGFANNFSGHYFAPQLEKKFPRVLFFNVFNSKFENFRTSIEPAEVMQKYDHFYLFGNRVDGSGIPYFDPKDLREIDSGGNFVLQEWRRD